MLELITLAVLCRDIGRRAREKGRSAGGFRLLTVTTWISGTIVGAAAGVLCFGDYDDGSDLSQYATALIYGCSFLGGLCGMLLPFLVLARLRDRLAAPPEQAFE